MRLWQRPQRFVALAREKSRAWSSALLVATLTLAMFSFGSITPPNQAEAAAAECPTDTAYIIYTYSSPNCTATFNYSGAAQSWTVPLGITSVSVTVYGAQGNQNGGAGGTATGTLSTTGGEVLNVYVGGQAGWNGGGAPGTAGGGYGGGGSDIRSSGNTLNDRLIVAGGGGGGGGQGTGGAGGGTTGANSATGRPSQLATGGTQSAGGTGGGNQSGTLGVAGSGSNGSFGQGGAGGYCDGAGGGGGGY